jgi:hypothetical protein
MATWHNVVAKKNKTRKQANVGTRQERHMKTTTTTTRKKGGRRTRVGGELQGKGVFVLE